MKAMINEMKAVAAEFTSKEWMAVVAGVALFVIVCGL